VKLRLYFSKHRPANIDEILDPIIRRRFMIYQRWLMDIKKSAVIGPASDIGEIPNKCPQSANGDAEVEFQHHFGQVDLSNHHLLRDVYNLLGRLVETVLMGRPAEEKNKYKQEEYIRRRLSMLQYNQYITLAILLILILILLLRGGTPTLSTALTPAQSIPRTV